MRRAGVRHYRPKKIINPGFNSGNNRNAYLIPVERTRRKSSEAIRGFHPSY